MTARKALLGELESLVLWAVVRLMPEASSARIRSEVAERGGRELSRGAMYATLSRLERKGFLEVGTPEPVAGQRARHHFTLTDEGLTALRTAHQNLARMRAGLESIVEAP